MGTIRGRTLILILLVILIVAGLAYDRGKKCGAWESEYAGAAAKTTAKAQHDKPLACWRVH
jgi:hypothetical protein